MSNNVALRLTAHRNRAEKTMAERQRTREKAAGSRVVQERERTLAELEAKNKALEAKNAELERFAYTVSHDLKSPLVTILGFTQVLGGEIAAGNTKQVQQHIFWIQMAARKMQHLLNDLLALSRSGRVTRPPGEVSLAALAYEAVILVAGPITARKVQVEIDPGLPTVCGDGGRLVEVFQNLIENAVKYMGRQPEPRIEIGAARGDQEILCFVRDNGIGIAPQFKEKIFDLFERLDGCNEGTGVGLARVKRIVEAHGGRTWVESEGEGQGSTFWFTLPQKQPDPNVS